MGSEKSQELPVIDFTKVNLSPNSSHWVSIRKKVQHAFENYGCFVLKYDEYLPELHNQMLVEVKTVLDSVSTEIKILNTFTDPWFYFHVPISSSSNREGFQIREATTQEGVTNFKSFVKAAGIQGNSVFCDRLLSNGKMLANLEKTIVKMVLEGYGVDKYLDSHVESMTYSMFVFRYGATQDTIPGLRAHSDKSFITILDTNHVKGLEIETKNGDQWLDYNPAPGHVIVMAGDAFFGWSNGRIHSPTHRVIYGGSDDDRYTIKFYSYSRDLVKVPKELVDDEHPLLFKPFSNFEYSEFSSEKLRHGPTSCNDLKLFCGV